jgi:copper(I)-binding protein
VTAMVNTRCRRCVLLFFGILVGLATHPSYGNSGDGHGTTTTRALANDADQGASANDPTKDKTPNDSGVSLIVVVTGNGKPVSEAGIEVRSPSGDRIMSRGVTNKEGVATFNFTEPGVLVKVLVIEDGWASAFQNVVLQRGSQKVMFQLNPLPKTEDESGRKDTD